MERNILEGKRDMLQHFLAVLAYRTQKALRGAPPEFSTFRPKQGVRTPHQTLCHMTNVLGYARTFLRGGTFRCDPKESFNSEISRSMGGVGEFKTRVRWSRLGSIPNNRVLRFKMTDPVEYNVYSLFANAEVTTSG